MKLKHKKEGRLQKGITLIALVITIIVLLILAGVSIATLTGDNGILTKAQTAKTETEKASEEEQIELAALNAAMNTEKYDYKVEDGTVPIPAGFAPTQIEGENSIKDGVVVVDAKGNEFVWIPCSSEEYKKAEWKEDWKQWMYRKNEDIEWSDSQTEIGMKSLQKLEQGSLGLSTEGIGFYVARYEAGISEDAPFYASKDGDTYYSYTPLEGDEEKIIKDTDAYIPVSKKGVPAWNLISQKKAKTVAENMIKNNDVQSYLIDSHAWNYICDKIITNYTEKNITGDWSSWGNYKDSPKNIYNNLDVLYAYHGENFLGGDFSENKKSVYHKGKISENVLPGNSNNYWLELSTGASEKFKAYNIYDMAGNMCEFTTEIGTNESNNGDHAKAVIRGGSFTESRYR